MGESIMKWKFKPGDLVETVTGYVFIVKYAYNNFGGLAKDPGYYCYFLEDPEMTFWENKPYAESQWVKHEH